MNENIKTNDESALRRKEFLKEIAERRGVTPEETEKQFQEFLSRTPTSKVSTSKRALSEVPFKVTTTLSDELTKKFQLLKRKFNAKNNSEAIQMLLKIVDIDTLSTSQSTDTVRHLPNKSTLVNWTKVQAVDIPSSSEFGVQSIEQQPPWDITIKTTPCQITVTFDDGKIRTFELKENDKIILRDEHTLIILQ